MTLGGRCPFCHTGILVEHHATGPSGWWFCPAGACGAWFDWRRRAAYLRDFIPTRWPD